MEQASLSSREEARQINTSAIDSAGLAAANVLSACASSDRLTTACIVDTAAFRTMQREWNGLYERCGNVTPFNSWEWLFSWWQSYGAAYRLRIVTFRRDGQLVGVVPLYLSRERSHLGLTSVILRFVGDGSADSDYMTWLVPTEDETECAEALVKWLQSRSEWDAIVLREMPAGQALRDLLLSAAKRLRWSARLEHSSCAVLHLPQSVDEFFRERQARFRTKLRSLLKKLDQGDVVFERDSNRKTLRKKLRSLFALHQARWQAAGEPGVFGSRAKRLFYARFATRYMRKDWLRLYSLRRGERYLAHQLCFKERGVIYLLQEGFDVSDPSSSYGQMLRAAVVRHLIENGERRYDFLGGYSQHKVSWGADQQSMDQLIIAKKSVQAHAYFHGPAIREGCIRSAEKLFPASVTAWLKQMFRQPVTTGVSQAAKASTEP